MSATRRGLVIGGLAAGALAALGGGRAAAGARPGAVLRMSPATFSEWRAAFDDYPGGPLPLPAHAIDPAMADDETAIY